MVSHVVMVIPSIKLDMDSAVKLTLSVVINIFTQFILYVFNLANLLLFLFIKNKSYLKITN